MRERQSQMQAALGELETKVQQTNSHIQARKETFSDLTRQLD
jgi:hypothetical protein